MWLSSLFFNQTWFILECFSSSRRYVKLHLEVQGCYTDIHLKNSFLNNSKTKFHTTNFWLVWRLSYQKLLWNTILRIKCGIYNLYPLFNILCIFYTAYKVVSEFKWEYNNSIHLKLVLLSLKCNLSRDFHCCHKSDFKSFLYKHEIL